MWLTMHTEPYDLNHDLRIVNDMLLNAGSHMEPNANLGGKEEQDIKNPGIHNYIYQFKV